MFSIYLFTNTHYQSFNQKLVYFQILGAFVSDACDVTFTCIISNSILPKKSTFSEQAFKT